MKMVRLIILYLAIFHAKDEFAELTPLTAELEADSSSRAKRVRPPHQGPPLPYTRRIEGLLQPKVGQPVLEGTLMAV